MLYVKDDNGHMNICYMLYGHMIICYMDTWTYIMCYMLYVKDDRLTQKKLLEHYTKKNCKNK